MNYDVVPCINCTTDTNIYMVADVKLLVPVKVSMLLCDVYVVPYCAAELLMKLLFPEKVMQNCGMCRLYHRLQKMKELATAETAPAPTLQALLYRC